MRNLCFSHSFNFLDAILTYPCQCNLAHSSCRFLLFLSPSSSSKSEREKAGPDDIYIYVASDGRRASQARMFHFLQGAPHFAYLFSPSNCGKKQQDNTFHCNVDRLALTHYSVYRPVGSEIYRTSGRSGSQTLHAVSTLIFLYLRPTVHLVDFFLDRR